MYRRVLWAFGRELAVHHRMGGLLSLRNASFADVEFHLSGEDPAQYRLHQEEVCRAHAMPFDGTVWQRYPPVSSHPACVAVKAAALQGFADTYLRRVREAFFVRCRPVDRIPELVELARRVPGLDVERFALEVGGSVTREMFSLDLAATRSPLPGARDVKVEPDGSRRYGFPTMIMMNADGGLAIFDADSTFDDYVNRVAELAPGLVPEPPPEPLEYMRRFGTAATREVAQCCEMTDAEAEQALERLRENGLVSRVASSATLPLWRTGPSSTV